MKKSSLFLSFGLLCGLSAFAQTKFDCVADTWVRGNNETWNQGGTSKTIEINTNDFSGFFAFSLAIPEGQKVESATLHLVNARHKGGNVTLYGYNHDFAEDTDYATEKSYIDAAKASNKIEEFTPAGQGNKDIADKGINDDMKSLDKWINDIDVTSYVASLPSSTSRVNFMLSDATAQNTFFSKENEGTDAFKKDDDTFETHYEASLLMPYLIVSFVADESGDDNGEDNGEDSGDDKVDDTDDGDDNSGADNGDDNGEEVPSDPSEPTIPEDASKFDCIADTWVRGNNETWNAGGASKTIEINANDFDGFFAFSFAVPAGQKVESATLHLVNARHKGGDVTLYGYDNDFAETTDWATEKAYVEAAKADNFIVTFTPAGQGNKDIADKGINDDMKDLNKWINDIDVTDYVASLPAETTRVNFLLADATAQNTFFSKENEGTDAFKKDDDTFETHYTADQLMPYLAVIFVDDPDADQPGDNDDIFGEDPGTSGVNSIESVNVTTEYYNLSGQKIVKPGKGIYIMHQGNKSIKIVK